MNDQLSAGVVVRSRQLNRQAQLAFRQLTRTDIEMRSVVLTDFIAGELESFPELTDIETVHGVVDFTDGLPQAFENPMR